MTFSGFPTKVKFTPVPNPFFNELLEQIDSLSELKCTMRIIWLLSQKNGSSAVLDSLWAREAEGRRKMVRTRIWKYVTDTGYGGGFTDGSNSRNQEELYDLKNVHW